MSPLTYFVKRLFNNPFAETGRGTRSLNFPQVAAIVFGSWIGGVYRFRDEFWASMRAAESCERRRTLQAVVLGSALFGWSRALFFLRGGFDPSRTWVYRRLFFTRWFRPTLIGSVVLGGYYATTYAVEDWLGRRNDMGVWEPRPRYAGTAFFVAAMASFGFPAARIAKVTALWAGLQWWYATLELHGAGSGFLPSRRLREHAALRESLKVRHTVIAKDTTPEQLEVQIVDYCARQPPHWTPFGSGPWRVANHAYRGEPSALEELKAELGLRARTWPSPLAGARMPLVPGTSTEWRPSQL